MKKNKLKLEKFTIAKLNSPHKIHGGNNDDDGTKNTKTEPLVCVQMSDVFIPKTPTNG